MLEGFSDCEHYVLLDLLDDQVYESVVNFDLDFSVPRVVES